MTCALIIPYFGKFKNYFDVFELIDGNSDWDWGLWPYHPKPNDWDSQ